MTAAANQHIEIEGGVLKNQVTTLTEVAAAFEAAAAAAAGPLPADAFSIVGRGILVPTANALAERSRELLSAAHALSARMVTGAEGSLTGFSEVEATAVDTFAQDPG